MQKFTQFKFNHLGVDYGFMDLGVMVEFRYGSFKFWDFNKIIVLLKSVDMDPIADPATNHCFGSRSKSV